MDGFMSNLNYRNYNGRILPKTIKYMSLFTFTCLYTFFNICVLIPPGSLWEERMRHIEADCNTRVAINVIWNPHPSRYYKERRLTWLTWLTPWDFIKSMHYQDNGKKIILKKKTIVHLFSTNISSYFSLECQTFVGCLFKTALHPP